MSQALERFAAERGVTLAVIGQSHRSRWYRFVRGSVADRLIEGRAGMDVLVVSIVDVPEYLAEKRRTRADSTAQA